MQKSNSPTVQLVERISNVITQWVGTPISIIAHTVFFIGIFALQIFGFQLDQILLILTTAVSLEAIYLAIFIQMTVNRNTASLEAVEDDIDDIQEDVEDIQENVDEVEEDIGEITEDLEQIQEEEIQQLDKSTLDTLQLIQKQLHQIQTEINNLQTDVKELKNNS